MLFFTFLTIVTFLAYTYIGRRLIAPSRLKSARKRIAWVVLMLLPLLVPFSFFYQLRMGSTLWSDSLGWLAYVSLGYFSLLFALLLVRDVTWKIFRKILSLPGRLFPPQAASKDSFDPERRRFLAHSMNLGVVGASALLTGYGFHEARRPPPVVPVRIPLRGLPPEFDGFRIAQISDIHVGPTIKRDYVRMVVKQVNRLGADLIVFTGDLADGSVRSLQEDVAPLGELSAPHGTYFVTGNHEYYSGAEPWVEEVRRLGFTVLLNEHRILHLGPSEIVLAGVTDYHAGRFIPRHATDPKAAIAGAPDGCVRILLAHQPRSVFAATQNGYDLQLSGHTHGGQYFYGNLLVALSQPYMKGLHWHENLFIYVNSGTGYWGPPLRLGAPSEITMVTLTAAKGQSAPI